MIGSIERGWRKLTNRPLVPMMIIIVGLHGPVDPSRRTTGYGGVIPVPSPTAAAPTTGSRADTLLDQQRRDQRAARGRILYATGKARQAVPCPEHKASAPRAERRVVQGHSIPSPNS